MPCHVPSISRPPPTGIASAVSVSAALDVRRHVVRALGAMDEQGIAIRYQPLEKGDKVAPDVLIGVFLDQQRRGRMPAKDVRQTGHNARCGNDTRRFFVNSIRPWPFVLSVNVR